MAALICLGVFLIEPIATVLFRIALAMYQAIAGVLHPATSPEAQFWQRITALLLLGSLACLAIGVLVWTSGLYVPGVGFVWLSGAIGLCIAGLTGSLLEQSHS